MSPAPPGKLALLAVTGLVAGLAACATAPPKEVVVDPNAAVNTPGTGAVAPVEAAETVDADQLAPRKQPKKRLNYSAMGKNCCKGKNECMGKGNCKSDANDCKGLNKCKGQGGCRAADCDASADAAGSKDCCKGKNDCKGLGGCKTDRHDCKGKNDCKGLGGCKSC